MLFILTLIIREKIKEKSIEVWHEIKEKIEVPLVMVGGLICRMLNFVATVHLNLFISSFYDRSDEGQEIAKTIATKLNGVSMSLAILMSFFVGYESDKISRSTILLITFGLSTLGFTLFTMIDNPESFLMYLSVICFNVGG